MTINTHNRAESLSPSNLRTLGACTGVHLHKGQNTNCFIVAIEDFNTLLDAARAEGPVQGERCWPHSWVRAGSKPPVCKYCGVEAFDDPDVAPPPPPADEVGRAVERLGAEVNNDSHLGMVRSADLRLILSHVSGLEGESEHAERVIVGLNKQLTEQFEVTTSLCRRFLESADHLKLAVEALENAQRDLGNIAFLRPGGPTRSKLVQKMKRLAIDARDRAVEALNSLRPSVSAPGGDVEASRHARSVDHAKVDTSGPISVPENVSVEGDHRQIHIAPIQEGDGR